MSDWKAGRTVSLYLPEPDRVVLRVVVRIVQSPLHNLARVFQKLDKLGSVQQIGLFRIRKLCRCYQVSLASSTRM